MANQIQLNNAFQQYNVVDAAIRIRDLENLNTEVGGSSPLKIVGFISTKCIANIGDGYHSHPLEQIRSRVLFVASALVALVSAIYNIAMLMLCMIPSLIDYPSQMFTETKRAMIHLGIALLCSGISMAGIIYPVFGVQTTGYLIHKIDTNRLAIRNFLL